MLWRNFAASMLMALAGIGAAPNEAAAYPVSDLVAYKAGEVYTYNGENYQDVMVGLKLSTDPAAWGITAPALGYDELVVQAATFGWFAQPTGSTENVLVSYNMLQRYEYGQNVPSEIFLYAYYSVKAPGGDFVMSGVLEGFFDVMLIRDPEGGSVTVGGAYGSGGQSLSQVRDAAESVAYAQITNRSNSIALSIDSIMIPTYSEGTGGTLRGPEFTQANFDSLLQRPNLINPNQFPSIPFEQSTTKVPEPGSGALVALALSALALMARRRTPGW